MRSICERDQVTRPGTGFLDHHDNITREQISPDTPGGQPQQYNVCVWGYRLLMVTLISITSVVGVGMMPLLSRYVIIIFFLTVNN